MQGCVEHDDRQRKRAVFDFFARQMLESEVAAEKIVEAGRQHWANLPLICKNVFTIHDLSFKNRGKCNSRRNSASLFRKARKEIRLSPNFAARFQFLRRPNPQSPIPNPQSPRNVFLKIIMFFNINRIM